MSYREPFICDFSFPPFLFPLTSSKRDLIISMHARPLVDISCLELLRLFKAPLFCCVKSGLLVRLIMNRCERNMRCWNRIAFCLCVCFVWLKLRYELHSRWPWFSGVGKVNKQLFDVSSMYYQHGQDEFAMNSHQKFANNFVKKIALFCMYSRG